MAVTDRHLNAIEDAIDSHPVPIYKNETFVYIFENGDKYSFSYPLDIVPYIFYRYIRACGSVVDLQVMKE